MTSWTDKKIEKLKKLWEKGLSTAEIGKKLDFSKNAIVGKVHRLGLSNRGSPIKTNKDKNPKPSTKTENVLPKKASVKKETVIENTEKKEILSIPNESIRISKISLKNKKSTSGVSLLELTSDLCCWPIDDINSDNFHFCGKKVFKNKPYCLEHCAIAYTTSANAMDDKEPIEDVFKNE